MALGIHIVAGEVIIKLLAVVLLLLLDVSEGVAHHGTCKFKNARVINARDVLFHRERIAAKVCIVFLFLLTNGRWRASKLAILERDIEKFIEVLNNPSKLKNALRFL